MTKRTLAQGEAERATTGVDRNLDIHPGRLNTHKESRLELIDEDFKFSTEAREAIIAELGLGADNPRVEDALMFIEDAIGSFHWLRHVDQDHWVMEKDRAQLNDLMKKSNSFLKVFEELSIPCRGAFRQQRDPEIAIDLADQFPAVYSEARHLNRVIRDVITLQLEIAKQSRKGRPRHVALEILVESLGHTWVMTTGKRLARSGDKRKSAQAFLNRVFDCAHLDDQKKHLPNAIKKVTAKWSKGRTRSKKI